MRTSKGAFFRDRPTDDPPLRSASRGGGRDSRQASAAVLDRVARAATHDATIAKLVERAQDGDELAFAELYVTLFDRVYRYLCIAVKNDQDAQEIAQDVFAKLLVALSAYDPERGEFKAWLFSMVRRMALDHLRRAARSDAVDPEALSQYMPRMEDRTAALRERFDPTLDLAGIVDSLPKAQRRVVVLRFAFDFTPMEIADVIGTTADAVRHTQHRALKAIASRLGAPEGEPAAA